MDIDANPLTQPPGPPPQDTEEPMSSAPWKNSFIPPIYLLFAWTIIALLAGAIAWLAGHSGFSAGAWTIGTIPIILFLGGSIVRRIMQRRVGVDAIALVSMTAALLLSQNLTAMVIAVMYTGGNVLEAYASGRAERDLSALRQRAPMNAHRIRGQTFETIAVEAVFPGDRLLIKPGEIVPVDGVVLSPEGQLDESTVTGEALPVRRTKGDLARSGTINAGGPLEMQASASADKSSYAGLIRLVDSAREERAPFVRMADRFATFLLPFTLTVAGLAWWVTDDPLRGLAVLVVATPCPLILAAPIAFVSGISRIARCGVLLRGGNVIETMAGVRTAIFDKTGTLTVGGARLIAVETSGSADRDALLGKAASLEQASNHAIAAAIVKAATLRSIPLVVPIDVEETHGVGIRGTVGGRHIALGGPDLVGLQPVPPWARRALSIAKNRGAMPIVIVIDGEAAGMLLMADPLRTEAVGTLHWLRALGVNRLVLLTGDKQEAADLVADSLPLDQVWANCTPKDKLRVLREEAAHGPVMMIGDGINDAPALAAADVGLAIGARGGSAASAAADAVLLADTIDRIPQAVLIARRTRAIARQSVVAGLALSLVAMVAAALGYLQPISGALVQEAIDVAVILNALRALGPASRRNKVPDNEDQVSIRTAHKAISDATGRLQEISDLLSDPEADRIALLGEAAIVIESNILAHEQRDARRCFTSGQPRSTQAALGYAHGEILALSRRFGNISDEIRSGRNASTDYRDAQRVIDQMVLLLRLHNVIEETVSYDG